MAPEDPEEPQFQPYQVIKDVGETLISLLKAHRDTTGLKPDEIVLSSPADVSPGDPIRLSLFLYQIIENPYMKNIGEEAVDETRFRHTPLYLDLVYMMTAYSGDTSDTTEKMNDARILGWAMQVFHDHSVITGPDLTGYLPHAVDAIRITMNPMTLDEMTKIWTTFPQKPFRPSVCYLVSPVKIESTREEEYPTRVTTKEMDYRYLLKKGLRGQGGRSDGN